MKASRVVVLLHQLTRTGAPLLTLDSLETLRRQTSVRIISWDGGPLLAEAQNLGHSVVLRPAGFGSALPGPLRSEGVVQVIAGVASRVRTIRQVAALRKWNPQLVYVSSVEALPMVRMLRLNEVPIVLHVHELGSVLAWFERRYPGLIVTTPDRYVAVSDAVARALVGEFGVSSDAVSVVPPYVLSTVPGASLTSPVTNRTPLIVGGAGKPSWTKGIDLWLLAAREAVDRLGTDKVRFVWVGYNDNLEGSQFRRMTSKLGLTDVVELIAETDRPYDQFARFDMFAMTSWEESASLVVLEAMAMGVPVICFAPTGGPAEEVGAAGVVIPEMSPYRMADAIVELAQSPQKRHEIGKAGAERVREHFSREKSLARLTQVLDAALG
jgi:glycosyltransferase involved in cell wall biosynthesis